MRRPSRGFTLIETMIVVAVASLILLIVFVAIPALQHNLRNSQRRSDIHKLFTGLDATIAYYPLGTSISSCTGNQTSCWVRSYQLSQYDSHSINVYWYGTTGPRGVLGPIPTNIDQVYIANWYKCNSDGTPNFSDPNINGKSVIAMYYIETFGGTAQQCTEYQSNLKAF